MQEKSNFSKFLKVAAICSFLGATTTALLIFLPNPPAADFEAQALLHQNPLYLFKKWLLFLHPQVNFIASLGIGVLLFRKYPLSIILGTLFLFIWAYTEMSQQALLIDALNQLWRPSYVAATDEVAKNTFSTLIKAAEGISDSHYFLVIYGFGLGCLFYSFAFISEMGWEKWIGYALLFIGILSLLSFGRYYLGLDFLSPIVNWSYTWIYPYLQPAVRVAIGVWIFRQLPNYFTATNA